MALAETAKMIVQLGWDGKTFTAGIKAAEGSLGKLETSASKLHKGFSNIGAGIGTAIRNGAILAGAALTALGAFLAESVKEGQHAISVQLIYAKAISNSGKVSAAYVTQLNAQQKALMNLGGIDDELIKSEQTRLIQMGLTGAQVAKLTPVVLDFSKATGIDLLTAAKLAGKSVAGTTGALARYGVMVDKAKAKTDPFGATLDALTKKFGGTTAALGGTFEARLGALRENLANIREDVGIKLLPSLTKIVDVVGKSLVPAFGKLVDRILPDISRGIDEFASALEGGGAEKAIGGIADALGTMFDLLKAAAGPVKTIVSAFLSLPKEVQGILVGAFAVNKLSGGLIGQGLGQVAGGLLQRGGTPANPLFVADVTGGVGKLASQGAAGGILQLLKTGLFVGIAAASIAALGYEIGQFMNEVGTAQGDLAGQVEATRKQSAAEAVANLNATVASLNSMNVFQRTIAETFGGGQITQDLIIAAEKLASSGLRGADAGSAAHAVAQALDLAKFEHFDAAIGPLTIALGKLTEAAKVGGEKLGTAAADAFRASASGALKPPSSEHGGPIARLETLGVSISDRSIGVLSRAVAHGLTPTANAIESTMRRNTERTAAATKAAFANYRAGEHADLMALRTAVLGAWTGRGEHGGSTGTDPTMPKPKKPITDLTDSRLPNIIVNAGATIRDIALTTAKSNTIGRNKTI